jgi:tRNA modification GTPase
VANGKLDLAQAEAVRDFIEAETLAQARSALGQLEGAMSGRLRPVRESLLALVAELEAGIDFPDDAPGGEAVAGPIAARLGACARPLEVLASSFDYGRLLTGGILVSILGRPNTGKSSIFNALISGERAIVSDVPGTTRDVVTETIEIGEIPVRLADTAGVREGGDPVETLGVQRSRETAAAADLVLLVLDGSEPLTETDQTLLRDRGPAALVVVNKTDLTPAWAPPGLPGPALRVSARSGAGIAELRESIQEWITDRRPPEAAGFVVTNARQRDCLREAAGALRQAARTALEGLPVELLLIDLYRGLEALGEVTGEVTNEDILGEIFSTFCIGK